MRCLGAEWPGRLLVFCSQGPSETCRTTRPGQSRGAALRGASCPRRPRRQPALRLLDPVLRGPTPGPGPQRPASGRAEAGEHGDGSGPCGWVSSSPPFPRQSWESLRRAAASPHQGVLPGAELPAACSAWFWAFPRHSETSTLGAPRGHDAGTRPGKEVQVAGLGGCCVVTGSSASWLIRASETRPAWAPPSCRAQGAQATRRHCPHSAARTAGPPAPEAAEVGVLTHTCSRAHRHSHPETHLLTHPDTHTPHATPERARQVPASLTVASPASCDNMLHGEDAILNACAVNEVTLNV